MREWSENTTTLATISETISDFLNERAWGKSHSPKNLSMSIAIEAAELMEIFQWVPSESAHDVCQDDQQFEHIKDEVADVMIYCISLANTLDFDLASAIQEKIEKNRVKYPVSR